MKKLKKSKGLLLNSLLIICVSSMLLACGGSSDTTSSGGTSGTPSDGGSSGTPPGVNFTVGVKGF